MIQDQQELSVARDGRPIETAPKDGTVIWLWAEGMDSEGPFLMHWDPNFINLLVSDKPGLWVMKGGGLTWSDQEYKGGPTHWCPQDG